MLMDGSGVNAYIARAGVSSMIACALVDEVWVGPRLDIVDVIHGRGIHLGAPLIT